MADTALTDEAVSDVSAAADHDDHAHGDHPTEAAYWKIFAILAVLTAVEVLWSYLGLSGPALVVPLIVMMLVKFVLVAGYFMHLKYDNSILNGRTFWLVFSFGLVLAVAVYFAVFASFEWQI